MVSVPAVALSALKKHRAAQGRERLVLGEAWGNPLQVFTSTIGTPLSKSTMIRRAFKPLLAKAGLPNIHFHDLRHSCATLLLAVGENMKTIQEMLGHSRYGTTADVYAHVLPGQQKQAAARMNEILTGGRD